ncbi:2-hydroxyacyl-CoA dehydratase subunit D [Sinanaerobacter chloroacetimidivorans]|jgi:bcr-type benzoyl-CoA reductase subunit C|uniref:2-hydroxyacyl-CoA dehydratase n=1 Tax=Sinanaerobacter chloroacetimidivorans TaxID=2818044 RepID=A0A8J7W369_9FIRM|nr:2-hydroxyacyl-CoA dehydratase family protein [Sinanaerobacter chloroacetimidivorans]MBR0598070.1 2-hydroxyacyl-CoA dehydratase [Sinanaerobacter chloroacetimidivorans]
MNDLMQLIRELEEIGENPRPSILKSMKETGKEAVGCFPIYTPEEIVYAAGMLPVGMWGGQIVGRQSDRYLQSFCCSIMKANTEQALIGSYDFLSAVILTTFCDTLKCIVENWKVALPQLCLIPMVYPQNRKIDAGKQFMREELMRVIAELEKVTGREITVKALEESVELYDEYRRTMQEFVDLVPEHQELLSAKRRHLIIKAAYFMDKKIYTEKLKKLIQEIKKMPVEQGKKKKIIITGLISEPQGMLDILTENGMVIVADDLAHESRQFRSIAPKKGDALDRMTERLALQDGCAFLYDEAKSRGSMLIDMVKKYDADGIIFCQLKFCDPEEFDYPIIKKELQLKEIPTLYIEIEQQMDSLEQLRTRIQSFAEMLA